MPSILNVMETYAMGYSQDEAERLMFQAGLLRPITERLLRRAGIGPGMRVLDVGSGAGDVALLAAGLVGPTGAVTGIDRDPGSVDLAAHRAHLAGLTWVEFRAATMEEFAGDGLFDAVVGRYVLIHQDDPGAFLKAAAQHVRPGGAIAFHELDVTAATRNSNPEVAVWEQTMTWLMQGAAAGCRHYDAGSRLTGHFAAGGLPEPEIHGEFWAGGGPGSPLYRWAADTARTMLPLLARVGIPADEVSVETLESRIRSAVVAAGAQVKVFPQYTALARV
jgi:2-polyprenyl-3-methyl-5-hydroxy-6-metoxy-1,4-benzoquinol methylase